MPTNTSGTSLRSWRLLALQFVLIFLVAVVSAYEVPDFSQLNQDVVLFLTPFGIVKNHFDSDSLLRPFYSEISSGQNQITTLRMALLAMLWLILVFNSYWITKGLKRR